MSKTIEIIYWIIFCISLASLILGCLALTRKNSPKNSTYEAFMSRIPPKNSTITQSPDYPIGKYEGEHSILGVTIFVTLTFNSQEKVSGRITGPLTVSCSTPEKYIITNGQIKFTGCLAQQISNNGIKLSSAYSKSDNTIIVNITEPLGAKIILYSSTEKMNWPETCIDNSQCNTWCSGKASTSTDYCCPIGGTRNGHLYWGKKYCDNLPLGTDCKSDAMCKSNYCEGNSGGFATGQCAPQPLKINN